MGIEQALEIMQTQFSNFQTTITIIFTAISIIVTIVAIAIPLINRRTDKDRIDKLEKRLEEQSNDVKELLDKAQDDFATQHREQDEAYKERIKKLTEQFKDLQTNLAGNETPIKPLDESNKEKAYALYLQALGEEAGSPKKLDLSNQAIELDPNNAEYRNYRAHAYYYIEQYEKAFTDYDKAIELDPNNVDFYRDRGKAYDDQEQYKNAIADYTKAIKLNPNISILYFFCGYAYYCLEQYEEALTNANKALELAPHNKYHQNLKSKILAAIEKQNNPNNNDN